MYQKAEFSHYFALLKVARVNLSANLLSMSLDSQNFQSQSDITIFAKTTFRNGQVPFEIRQTDRSAHIYIIGKTGTGKSTLLETLMTENLRKGLGFALLDPHGDLVKKIYNRAMALRQKDLLFFDAPNPNQPFGFNPLENVSFDKRSLAASGILQVFKHLWSDSWGPRLEHIHQ